ncbi:hypothetical protein Tco_0887155 [Tanacetum coccineum]
MTGLFLLTRRGSTKDQEELGKPENLWTNPMKLVLLVGNNDIFKKIINVMSKKKSEKGLVTETFNWDVESLSFDDEGLTRVKAFMAIAEDEPAVGKADARLEQWVEITMKKGENSPSKTSPDDVSDSEYVDDNQEPLPPLPKLSGSS